MNLRPIYLMSVNMLSKVATKPKLVNNKLCKQRTPFLSNKY